MALVSPWIDWSSYNGIDPVNTSVFHAILYGPEATVSIGALLFVVGAVVAFGSPIGGFFEIAGAIFFLGGFLFTAHRMPSMIGFYFAILSGSIVTISFLRPIGIGFKGVKLGLDERKYMYSKMTVEWLKQFIMDILHPQW
jgi:hypothetical protein